MRVETPGGLDRIREDSPVPRGHIHCLPPCNRLRSGQLARTSEVSQSHEPRRGAQGFVRQQRIRVTLDWFAMLKWSCQHVPERFALAQAMGAGRQHQVLPRGLCQGRAAYPLRIAPQAPARSSPLRRRKTPKHPSPSPPPPHFPERPRPRHPSPGRGTRDPTPHRAPAGSRGRAPSRPRGRVRA